MYSRLLVRLAAIAAITGAACQLVATVLEPDWGGEPNQAARVVAESTIWIPDRLLDLTGVLLTVVGLTVVGARFVGVARDWARVGTPFLIIMGGIGGSAVVTGAVMKDLAQKWAEAGNATEASSYLGAFDVMRSLTGAQFFVAFLALGTYLVLLAPAILQGDVFPHWTGWASAVGGSLVITGNLVTLAYEPAFFAVLAGFALFLVVLAALGVCLWRRGAANQTTTTQITAQAPATTNLSP